MSAAAFTITAAAVTARPTAIRATRATMPTRGARVSQAATMKGAPDTTLSSANQITDDDVSSWEEIDRQIFAMCSKYIGDSSVNPRIMAATELNAEKTFEALDDITVVEVYQAAYDGGLDECTTIIDTHLRMLAECIIQDDVELVRSIYGKFRRLPPMLQKSSLIATAAVAEAGLLFIREEYELVEAMLRDEVAVPDVSEDAKNEYEKSKVIVDYMDKVIAVMHEEKGEVNGEIVSSQPSVSNQMN